MVVAMASSTFGLISFNATNSSLKKPLVNPPLPTGSPVLGPKSITSIAHKGRWSSSSLASIKAQASSATVVEDDKPDESDVVPVPKVIIDQDSDPDATVVEITFGDRLSALLDTTSALKNLGLNVVKANVFLDSSGKHNKFAITRADTGRKLDDPELPTARNTCFSNFWVDVDIATRIHINEDGPSRIGNSVESADRPGLLVDLVKIITDINIAVESGEFDTEGILAKAKFHVSYRGKPIIKPLQQVLANSLRYFLRRPATEEASF